MILQEDKMKAIVAQEQTVVSVSKELGVSRQTIYKWLARYKRFGTPGLLHRVRKKRTAGAYNRISPEVETLVENIAQTYWQDGIESLPALLQLSEETLRVGDGGEDTNRATPRIGECKLDSAMVQLLTRIKL